MPRLTNPAYLLLRRELSDAWDLDPTGFFLLSAPDQWALHDYFRPSEMLSDAELLEHRRAVSASDPSLPQRAGRAVAKWQVKQERLGKHPVTVRQSRRGTKRSKDYEIRLFAEVQPTLDPDVFARILVRAADEQRAIDVEVTSGSA